MTDKKPCPVCIYLKAYSEELILKVNSFVFYEVKDSSFSESKLKDILDLLAKSKVLNNKKKPTLYFFKKHVDNCLIYFKPSYNHLENIDVDDGYNLCNKENVDLEDFDCWSSIKKEQECSRLLHRIYYKKLIHIDSINNKSIANENVTSLKNLKEMINDIDIRNINLDVDDKNSIEKTGVDLIKLILAKDSLNLDYALNIAKILIDKSKKLGFMDNKEDLETVENDRLLVEAAKKLLKNEK